MPGETILVVEDEGLIAIHLIELLENAGYRVAGIAASGEKVLQAIDEGLEPDLILMDIGLAGSIDGIETARKIRQRFSVPLIFVTAYSSETTLGRMSEVAPEGVIFKPFMEKELLKLVADVLTRSSTLFFPGIK